MTMQDWRNSADRSLPDWLAFWRRPGRTTLAFWAPSGVELIIILAVALIIFGRRLPEVARNLGRSVNEFKKGLREPGPAEGPDAPAAEIKSASAAGEAAGKTTDPES